MAHLLSINAYHYRRGGADAVYFDLAKLFAEHGWETSFFSMRRKENLPCEDEDFFPECIDYAKAQTRTLSNAVKIIYSVEAQRKLAALLDKKRPDVAHAHNIYHSLSPSVLTELKSRGIPSVMTAHDFKLVCPNNKMLTHDRVCERCRNGHLWNAIRYRCVKDSFLASSLVALESAIHQSLGLYRRHLDRIIAPSMFLRDKLVEFGWDPKSITFIPNAVAMRDTPVLAPGSYFLYVGRLSPEKGVETLIRAVAKARVPLKVAGTGPESERLKDVATELNAPVEFLGFLSGKALWEAVDGARAVVLPSECYENGPMSVLEAFVSGRPVIGARIGGIPELVKQNCTGWLFASGNCDELTETLAQVAAMDDAAVTEVGAQAREWARNNRSIEGLYSTTRALYSELGV